MKKFLFLLTALLAGGGMYAQYASRHYIAPSPWQYWSDANEIVVSTKEAGEIQVRLSKSDGSFITAFAITSAGPVAYRFDGNPTLFPRNEIGSTYSDRGLIVDADAPVLVNLRNIASDASGTSVLTIKGNASLVSFGNEGAGTAFRLGYYRSDYAGISGGMPIYSAMAIENNTTLSTNGGFLVSLDAGESYIFTAEMGTLLTSDKPIVSNTGSYGDTPQACSGSGQDGTVDQIAPVDRLGMQYLLVRGSGTAGTITTYPEQSTIIASEPGTTVQIANYDVWGSLIGTTEEVLATAGSFVTIFHGDAESPYSSSFVNADKPVVIYSANAVGCETDVSTVLPIGGCSGSVSIITKKFLDYNGEDLPYFGYTMLESATDPVFLNGADLESVKGIPRVAIGDTGFYMLRFTNTQIGNPENIAITSDKRLTTSIIQQGSGFSMSAFFSAFSNAPDPIDQQTDANCAITLHTAPGFEPYAWYLDGVLLPGETAATLAATQSGNYTVTATAECGITPPSAPVYVTIWPPITAGMPSDMIQCLEGQDNIFTFSSLDATILGNQVGENYNVTYHSSLQDAEVGHNAVSELRIATNTRVYARVTNTAAGCYAISSFGLLLAKPEIDMPATYTICKGSQVILTAPAGYISYGWSTGENTQSIVADQAGTITLIAVQEINGVLCEASIAITVREVGPATIKDIVIGDWTHSQNTITIIAGGEGDFEFSINGVSYQDDPQFNNLAPGAYTVFARDKNGCGGDEHDTYLLMYPNFFTPNGDGTNEYWRIQYASLEPDMQVHIFDRYGKRITSFDGKNQGWDGTLNGLRLPSTDYWFLVESTDGKVHRGHFTLKR